MEIDYKMIGEQIRIKRKEKGWTQAELAERSGIEPSNISHIERAATKLSLPTLFNIAYALDASLDELAYTNLKESTHISNKIINELLSDCTSKELYGLAELIKTAKNIMRNH